VTGRNAASTPSPRAADRGGYISGGRIGCFGGAGERRERQPGVRWRRLYQRGLLGGNVPSVALVPVKVTESAAAPVPPDPATAAAPTGSIQLRLPKGQLRIDGAVDAALLRVLVECLLR